MTSVTTSNDAYASNVPDRGTTGFTTNGLNELATIDGGAVSYDTNGNLTIDPWLNHSFSYNAEDQMTAASQLSATAGLTYDPLGRLDTYNPSSGAFRRFVYDGDEVAAELDSSGSIVNRYIRGDAPDEVLLQYAGSGSSSYRYYHLDERMSPIAWSDEAGALATLMHYDEYGIPDPTNLGRFQYTGQMWLSEIGEYFYKTRGFSANMGRFLQTDRMGYSAGPNLYAYVGNDPVNAVDPLGLQQIRDPDIIVTAVRPIDPRPAPPFGGSLTGGAGMAGSGGESGGSREHDIVVTGKRWRPFGRTIRVTLIQPDTLLGHYLFGSKENICLSDSQFKSIARHAHTIGSKTPYLNGFYAQRVGFDNFAYAASFGVATMYFGPSGNAVGFYDRYDFDAKPNGTRSFSGELSTTIGRGLGSAFKGEEFEIGYPCR